MNKEYFKMNEGLAGVSAAQYREKNKILKHLEETQKITGITVEDVAGKEYAKHGLNAAIVSKVVDGKKVYAPVVYGTELSGDKKLETTKDLYQDGKLILKLPVDQVKDLVRFLDAFRTSNGILEPFVQSYAHSLGCITLSGASALHPYWFREVVLAESPGIKTTVEQHMPNHEARLQLYNKMKIVNDLPNAVNTFGEQPPEVPMYYAARTTILDMDSKHGTIGTVRNYVSSLFELHPLQNQIDSTRNGDPIPISHEFYKSFSNAYTVKAHPEDLSKQSAVFNFDGKVCAKGNTGAVKVGDTYTVKYPFGTKKETIAKDYGVHIGRIETPLQMLTEDLFPDIHFAIHEGPTKEYVETRTDYHKVVDQNDITQAWWTNKATGHKIFQVETGAKKLTHTTYVVHDSYGSCEQDIATKYGVHVDNVIENVGTNLLDMQSKSFTIIGGKSSSVKSDNPQPFLSSFGSTIHTADFMSYNNPAIDSFISGSYTGLYDFDSYLITPFQKWTSLSFSEDMNQRLDFLKQVGFYRDYTLNTAEDYTFTASVSDVASDYRYIAQQPYQRYDHMQQQDFNAGYRSVNYQNPTFSGGNWAKKYYDNGYGYEYNRPGTGFTLGIRKTFPIAISLEGDISLVPYEKSPVFFDIDDDGYYENVAWVGNKDTILVYDYNEDKVVSSAKEIIFTKWDDTAKTDFEAFKNKFDSNKDNVFNNLDAEFGKFYLWQDLNQDGVSQPDELSSLEDKGVTSIDLTYITATEALKEQGVLNTAKVSWSSGKETTAYDLTLSHSIAGIRYSAEQSTVTIKLPKGGVYQTLRAEPNNKALDIDLSSTPSYHIILGSTENDKITAGTAPKLNADLADQGLIIDGSDGDDVIVTGKGNDWVKGGVGKDSISTGDGHDILFVDAEDTNIDGGKGFDVAFVTSKQGVSIDLHKSNIEAFYGNGGNDIITAANSPEAVQIHGNAGNDELIGSDHDDILVGGLGQDKIKAGKGNDKIFIDKEDDLAFIDGGDGEDSVYVMDSQGVTVDMDAINVENFIGGAGNDIVSAHGEKKYIFYGGKGNDELTGGQHDNVLDGGPGDDILRGGKGANKYMFGPDYGHDTIYSQGKEKTGSRDLVLLSSKLDKSDLVFSQQGQDLRLDIKSNPSSLTISNWFVGAQHQVDGFVYKADDESNNHHLILHEDKAALFLKDGRDWIVFSLLNTDSVIEGGSGSEFYRLGNGNDLIIGWGGNDIVYAGSGNDEIIAWDSNDKEYPGGNVVFYGEDGNDTLVGWKGNDILSGGEGNDIIVAKEGDDIIYTGNGNDKVTAGIGNDKIFIQGVGQKEIYGGPGSDSFIIEPSDIKEIGKYIIGDFDINDKNEKIDFSKMSSLIKSLEPKYLGVFDHTATIDPSICKSMADSSDNLLICKENTEQKVASASMCWTLGPGTDDYYRCITLVGVTKDQVMNSPESFIFAD